MWYIGTMEYYLAIKRNKLQIHASLWRNQKNTTLRERSQLQEKAHEKSRKGKSRKIKRLAVAGSWGRDGVTANWAQTRQRKCSKTGGDGCTPASSPKKSPPRTLERKKQLNNVV